MDTLAYVTCPKCHGEGGSFGFIDGPAIHSVGAIPCSACRGTGKVDEKHARLMEWGGRLRTAMVARGMTASDLADRIGCDTIRVFRLRQGQAAPTANEVLGIRHIFGDDLATCTTRNY